MNSPRSLNVTYRTLLCTTMLLSALVVSACSSSEPAAPAPEGPAATGTQPASGTSAAEPSQPQEAPTPATAPVRSDVPDQLEGANRTMEKATVNGFETTNLQCNTKGGLFAGMSILGGLAKQKATFEGCATKNEAVRVHFAYDGNKTSDVRVADASDPAIARCVADAIGQVTFPDPCTCVIAFKVGPPAATPAEPAETPAAP